MAPFSVIIVSPGARLQITTGNGSPSIEYCINYVLLIIIFHIYIIRYCRQNGNGKFGGFHIISAVWARGAAFPAGIKLPRGNYSFNILYIYHFFCSFGLLSVTFCLHILLQNHIFLPNLPIFTIKGIIGE